eukprot:TRINITY_DN68697_c0_g1_i1.p1 TRINITY_DN68697_c0_g1~~TRINITY_DN68697_c0_g1_i1.p1  ORF type:complete len:352 (-),score=85.07 TRINITY_DN68697_c0_g1_i1:51-1106(-)
MVARKNKKSGSRGKSEEKEGVASAETQEKIPLPEADVTLADDADDASDASETEGDPQSTGKSGSKRKTKADRFQKMQDEASEKEPTEPRGVVYLGHIPEGFAEPQIKVFFAQFGTVTRYRMARSKRNGHPKGYGFIEFEDESVAKIVADTMNKYLLFEKQLVCHVVPPEKQHRWLFRGWKRKTFNKAPARLVKARKIYNDRPFTLTSDGTGMSEVTERQVGKRNNKEKKLRLALKELGVDYDPDEAREGPRLLTNRKKNHKKKAPEAPEKDLTDHAVKQAAVAAVTAAEAVQKKRKREGADDPSTKVAAEKPSAKVLPEKQTQETQEKVGDETEHKTAKRKLKKRAKTAAS